MMERIAIGHDAADKTLILEWEGSPENDMWADAVVMMVLELEGSPQAIKSKGGAGVAGVEDDGNLRLADPAVALGSGVDAIAARGRGSAGRGHGPRVSLEVLKGYTCVAPPGLFRLSAAHAPPFRASPGWTGS